MKKRFGQHLLVDKNYLRKILGSLNLESSDYVFEIGSGTGILTCELAKHAKKVIAVELEYSIIKELRENLKSRNIDNVEVIESSFLKLDLNKILNGSRKWMIVGNIPYNITSQILLKLFGEIDKPQEHLKFFKSIHLMLQKEVAERVVAKPHSKAYSPFTLLVQYFSKPEILFTVPSCAFYPRPKVDSAFVAFHLKEKLQPIMHPEMLKSIIRVSFQQRRKKVINSLNKLIVDKKQIERVFDKLQIDHNLRAENLDFEKYLAISNNI